jgi:hypothetical protein
MISIIIDDVVCCVNGAWGGSHSTTVPPSSPPPARPPIRPGSSVNPVIVTMNKIILDFFSNHIGQQDKGGMDSFGKSHSTGTAEFNQNI